MLDRWTHIATSSRFLRDGFSPPRTCGRPSSLFAHIFSFSVTFGIVAWQNDLWHTSFQKMILFSDNRLCQSYFYYRNYFNDSSSLENSLSLKVKNVKCKIFNWKKISTEQNSFLDMFDAWWTEGLWMSSERIADGCTGGLSLNLLSLTLQCLHFHLLSLSFSQYFHFRFLYNSLSNYRTQSVLCQQWKNLHRFHLLIGAEILQHLPIILHNDHHNRTCTDTAISIGAWSF